MRARISRHALDVAQPGDQVVLDAGATYTGNFVLPKKSAGPTDRRAAPAPARHARGDARRAGGRRGDGAGSRRPNDSGAITTATGAHDWRFVGIEFGIAPGTPANYGIVRLGRGDETRARDLPSDIVVDRCWVHGNPTGNARRGVSLNGIRLAVIDSYLSDFHEVGADAQAIVGLERARARSRSSTTSSRAPAENVLFGGADSTDRRESSRRDIEIRRNHFFKPLSWQVGDPTYAGKHWSVKNLFELKSARRVLVEGNVLENNWGDAQTGFAVNLKSANQDGTRPGRVPRTSPSATTSSATPRVRARRSSRRDPHTEGLTKRRDDREQRLRRHQRADWKGLGHLPAGRQRARAPPAVTPRPGPATWSSTTTRRSTPAARSSIDAPPSHGFVFTNNIVAHNRYGVKGTDSSTGPRRCRPSSPGTGSSATRSSAARRRSIPPDNFFPAT